MKKRIFLISLSLVLTMLLAFASCSYVVMICPECEAECDIDATVCPECEYKLPKRGIVAGEENGNSNGSSNSNNSSNSSNSSNSGSTLGKAKCSECRNNGKDYCVGHTCGVCSGRGNQTCAGCHGSGKSAWEINGSNTCRVCYGMGTQICPNCDGGGMKFYTS